jgi:hypothetical protein
MSQATDFGDEILEGLGLCSANEAPASRQFALGIKFRMGAESDEEMVDVAGRPAAAAFGDI